MINFEIFHEYLKLIIYFTILLTIGICIIYYLYQEELSKKYDN